MDGCPQMHQIPNTVSSWRPIKRRWLLYAPVLFASLTLAYVLFLWLSHSISISEIALFRDQSPSVESLHFTKDVKTLVIVNRDNTVQFWDIAEKRLIREIVDHRGHDAVLQF